MPCVGKWLSQNGYYTLHISHAGARFNIMVMITLGEGMIQLLYETLDQDHIFEHISLSVTGFLILYGLALMYFEAQPHQIQDHFLRRSTARSYIAEVVYPLLYFALFLSGIAFKLAVYLFMRHDHQPPEETRTGSASVHLERRLLGVGAPWDQYSVRILVACSLTASELLILCVRYLHEGAAGIWKTRGAFAKFSIHVLVCFAHLGWGIFICVISPRPVQLGSGSLLLPHLLIIIPTILIELQRYSRVRHQSWSLHQLPHTNSVEMDGADALTNHTIDLYVEGRP